MIKYINNKWSLNRKGVVSMELILSNLEWIFSGIGVFILSLFMIKNKNKYVQKSGKNSKNFQSGRDINIGKRDD